MHEHERALFVMQPSSVKEASMWNQSVRCACSVPFFSLQAQCPFFVPFFLFGGKALASSDSRARRFFYHASASLTCCVRIVLAYYLCSVLGGQIHKSNFSTFWRSEILDVLWLFSVSLPSKPHHHFHSLAGSSCSQVLYIIAISFCHFF